MNAGQSPSEDLVRIETPEAPAAIGPYCQALSSGGFLFCSGQIPVDPKSGEMSDGDVRQLTERCLRNLDAVCRAAGTDLERATKVTIYLTEMKDFAEMNEAYGSYFDSHVPARTTFAVSALPAGARIEMDAIVALR